MVDVLNRVFEGMSEGVSEVISKTDVLNRHYIIDGKDYERHGHEMREMHPSDGSGGIAHLFKFCEHGTFCFMDGKVYLLVEENKYEYLTKGC